MEEFRQQIVDGFNTRLKSNLGQIQKDDFVFINEECRKLLVKTVLDKLNSEVTFNGIQKTYSKFIEMESKNIADYLMYQKKYKNVLHKMVKCGNLSFFNDFYLNVNF